MSCVTSNAPTRAAEIAANAASRLSGVAASTTRSEGGERARGFIGGLDEPFVPLQTDWIGSRAIIAMAVQCSRGSGLAGDLRRNAAHAGSAEGADQQDRSQRCPGRAIAQAQYRGAETG